MWPGSGFSGFTLFGLFKNKLLLERDREKRSVRDLAFPQDHFKKKQSFSVFFFMRIRSHDGVGGEKKKYFFLFWNCGV